MLVFEERRVFFGLQLHLFRENVSTRDTKSITEWFPCALFSYARVHERRSRRSGRRERQNERGRERKRGARRAKERDREKERIRVGGEGRRGTPKVFGILVKCFLILEIGPSRVTKSRKTGPLRPREISVAAVKESPTSLTSSPSVHNAPR